MGSTALQLAASAYKQANQDQDLTSFSMTDYPYNIAKDLFNTVIQEMNRWGRYWFAETQTALTYSNGVYQYNCTSLGIDPKGILRIRKEATDHYGELTQMNKRRFQQLFRRSTISTGEPCYWTKYAGVIELNSIPDQDYSLQIYYLRDLPLITSDSDTLLCQETDEDVFREGAYAYLLQRLGRADWQTVYQMYQSKAMSLLANMKQDDGQPTQFPRMW